MHLSVRNILFAVVLISGSGCWLAAETAKRTIFHVDVNMVVLSFTVTDSRGRYVTGLKPDDIRLTEDNIAQRINTFNEAQKRIEQGCAATGNSVFVMVDTSNCMYEGFTHAADAVAAFIRSLPPCDGVAVYGFSRNLTRAARLTTNRFEAIRGLRDLVGGDDTALYNSLLLVLRDAAKVPGGRMIVVFSNGPDNASIIAPDDVRRVAEQEGVPIYVVSTRSNKMNYAAFERITNMTGGKFYSARSWQKQARAFDAIGDELRNSYTVTYYPARNPNDGFRKIQADVMDNAGKRLRVHARPGYRPKKVRTVSSRLQATDVPLL